MVRGHPATLADSPAPEMTKPPGRSPRGSAMPGLRRDEFSRSERFVLRCLLAWRRSLLR